MAKDGRFNEIKRLISATLQVDFEDVRILEVRVRDDVDSDGDDILIIDVVFEGQPKDLDARKLSGAVRRVRPGLFELGEEAFPLFSFVSKTDADKSFASA